MKTALALVAAVVALVAPPAAAAPTQDATDETQIELIDRSPWVDAAGTLTLDVAVDPGVDAVSVTVHGRLDSPDELTTSLTEDEGPVIFTGIFPVADATPIGGGSAESSPIRFTFDVSDTVNEGSTIRMAFAGVYPTVVTPLDATGNPGEPIRTPVTRRSGAGTTLAAPALSIVVDLSTSPTATAEEAPRPFDDVELARFERLAALVERAGQTTPITVLASADTVSALQESSEPSAKRLVEALSTPGVVVVPQPTVPLDWPAVADAELDHLLPGLIAHGRSVIGQLDATVQDDIWDARGGVDAASLEAIADAGYRRVLVTPETAVGPDDGSGDGSDDTDASRIVARDRSIDDAPKDLAVVAVDEAIADALETTRQRPDAAHIALADLVLRSPEPSTAIAVVVEDTATDSALMAALDLMGEAGSPVVVVPLDGDVPPTDPSSPDSGGPDSGNPDSGSPDSQLPAVTPTEPDRAARADIADLAPDIADASASTDLYASIAGEDDAATSRARALIGASLQRNLDRDERSSLIAGASHLTSAITDSVHIVGPRDLNLTSRTGTLPIGVVNDGSTTITVVLAARSDRLSFPEDESQTPGPLIEIGGQRWQTIILEVPPGEIRFDLAVEALASGSVPLFIELRSPDGNVVLNSRRFNVRSTAVSGAGLIISIGALVVLVVWWFRTWHKGRPKARVTPDART